MEGISRIDIEKAIALLRKNKMSKIADRIEKADIIPKLYVYTYFKKVKTELDGLQGDGKNIDPDDLQGFIDDNPKLGLWMLNDKTTSGVRKVQRILNNGFERENAFCDFNDSKYHGKTIIGKCQCETHSEDIEIEKSSLTEEEKKIFVQIRDTKGWYEAYAKFQEKLNPDQKLSPVYHSDEDIGKYTDEPDWWCKACRDSADGEVGDVSCDME